MDVLAGNLGRPHQNRGFLRPQWWGETLQHWNPEVFNQMRCSRTLHVEFALSNRELVKAQVFEKRVFEQTAPSEWRNEGGIFLEQPFCRYFAASWKNQPEALQTEVSSWTSAQHVRAKRLVLPGCGGPDRSFWLDVRRDVRPKTFSLGGFCDSELAAGS